MSAITNWDDVRKGDVLTIQKPYRRRPYKLRVLHVDGTTLPADSNYRWLRGERLTMAGNRSGFNNSRGIETLLGYGHSVLLHPDDVVGVVRPVSLVRV